MNNTEDGALYLHSNEIGETVGRVRVLVVHDWPPNNTPNALSSAAAVGGRLRRMVRLI